MPTTRGSGSGDCPLVTSGTVPTNLLAHGTVWGQPGTGLHHACSDVSPVVGDRKTALGFRSFAARRNLIAWDST